MGSHLLKIQEFRNWKRLRIHWIQLFHIKSEEAVISLRSHREGRTRTQVARLAA